MMEMQIPEGLRALMQASQVLQEESMPVVQTPVGPRPTVAGTVSQGLQQLVEQRAQPSMQTVGLQGLGRQAGIGAQIQAQQQARQQQMAQNPQAIAQMAAQMLRPEQQGIANLPANMQFKDGGIIGYNGESDSVVDAMQARAEKELSEVEAGMRYGISPEVERYLKSRKEPSFPADEFLAAMPALTPVPPAPRAPVDIRDRPPYPVRGPMTVGESVPKAPEKGIAAPPLTEPREPSAGIVGIKPPSTAELKKAAEALAPQEYLERADKARKENERLRKLAMEGMPNLEQEGIAAILRTREERRELYRRNAGDDNLRRFLSAMRTLKTGGDEYTRTLDSLSSRDELHRQAEAKEADAILKFKQAEQAKKLGEFDRANELIKEGMAEWKAYQTTYSNALQSAAQVASTTYQTQMRSADVARQSAQQAADRAELKKQREQGALQSALMAAQSRVAEASKVLESLQDKYKIAAMATPDMLKDPNIAAKYKEYMDARQRVIEDVVNPAIAERDRLSELISGVPAPQRVSPSSGTTIRYDASGKRVQ